MKTIVIEEPLNLKVIKFELNFDILNSTDSKQQKTPKEIRIPRIVPKKKCNVPPPPQIKHPKQVMS